MSKDILLVDTEAPQLQSLNSTLQTHGYTPTVVVDAAAALQMLDSCDCQLVFLNLGLPAARSICDAMRNSVGGALVPAIFIGSAVPGSGDATIRSPADALSAGGDYYFPQPLDMGRVLSKVQTYVGLSDQGNGPLFDLEALDQPSVKPLAAPQEESLGLAGDDALMGASDALLAQIMNQEDPAAPAGAPAPTEDAAQGSTAAQPQIWVKADPIGGYAADSSPAGRAGAAAGSGGRASAGGGSGGTTGAGGVARDENAAGAGGAFRTDDVAGSRGAAGTGSEAGAGRAGSVPGANSTTGARSAAGTGNAAGASSGAGANSTTEARSAAGSAGAGWYESADHSGSGAAGAPGELPRDAKHRAFAAAVNAPLTAHKVGAHVAPTAITYRALSPTSGTLSQSHDVARLLCDAYRQRVTGRVVLENGHAQVVVYLLEGVPVKVHSLSSHDRLEEYLLRTRHISAAQYQQLRMRGLRHSSKVRAYALEKKFLGPDVLVEALHAQLREQVLGLFEFSTATYSYGPQLCEADSRLTLRQDPRALIMEGIRKAFCLAQLQVRVGAPHSCVSLCPDQQAALDALHLGGAELALLSLLDGHRTLQDVASISGLPLQRVYQAVYGMLCVDAAQLTVNHPVAQDDPARATDQAAMGRIMEKLEQVRMQDYLQVLQLSHSAGPQDVESAFLRTSQQFAPAAFSPAVQSELSQCLAEIQQAVQEAYEVLQDAELRGHYTRHVA
jgi:CheY-like chemotaxis protein